MTAAVLHAIKATKREKAYNRTAAGSTIKLRTGVAVPQECLAYPLAGMPPQSVEYLSCCRSKEANDSPCSDVADQEILQSEVNHHCIHHAACKSQQNC